MKQKILVVAAIPRQGLAELEKKFDLIYPTENFLFSDDEIRHFLPQADGVLSVFTKPFTAEMMAMADRLRPSASATRSSAPLTSGESLTPSGAVFAMTTTDNIFR